MRFNFDATSIRYSYRLQDWLVCFLLLLFAIFLSPRNGVFIWLFQVQVCTFLDHLFDLAISGFSGYFQFGPRSKFLESPMCILPLNYWRSQSNCCWFLYPHSQHFGNPATPSMFFYGLCFLTQFLFGVWFGLVCLSVSSWCALSILPSEYSFSSFMPHLVLIFYSSIVVFFSLVEFLSFEHGSLLI